MRTVRRRHFPARRRRHGRVERMVRREEPRRRGRSGPRRPNPTPPSSAANIRSKGRRSSAAAAMVPATPPLPLSPLPLSPRPTLAVIASVNKGRSDLRRGIGEALVERARAVGRAPVLTGRVLRARRRRPPVDEVVVDAAPGEGAVGHALGPGGRAVAAASVSAAVERVLRAEVRVGLHGRDGADGGDVVVELVELRGPGLADLHVGRRLDLERNELSTNF